MAIVGAPLAAVGAAGVASLTGYVRQMNILASRTGLTTQQADAFTQLSLSIGASEQSLEVMLKTFGERINQIRAGSSEVVRAFSDLGLDKEEFISASAVERMAMVADGMERIGDIGTGSGVLLAIAGEAGSQLQPLLRLGGDIIRKVGREGIGVGISRETAKAADQLTTAWAHLGKEVRKLGAAFVTDLVPVLLKALDLVKAGTERLYYFNKEWEGLIPTLLAAGAALLGVGAILTAVAPLMAGFAAASAVGLGAVAPIAAIVALLPIVAAEALYATYLLWDLFKSFMMFETAGMGFYDWIDGLIWRFGTLVTLMGDFIDLTKKAVLGPGTEDDPLGKDISKLGKYISGATVKGGGDGVFSGVSSTLASIAGKFSSPNKTLSPAVSTGGWGGWAMSATDSRVWGNSSTGDTQQDIMRHIRDQAVGQTELQKQALEQLLSLNQHFGAE
ncbi:MAG: hypothetical protein GY753_02110 [Gammaproteobacteria bacterium]|nr:hypothetical protein [Gammaproteobacteria bacterium]